MAPLTIFKRILKNRTNRIGSVVDADNGLLIDRLKKYASSADTVLSVSSCNEVCAIPLFDMVFVFILEGSSIKVQTSFLQAEPLSKVCIEHLSESRVNVDWNHYSQADISQDLDSSLLFDCSKFLSRLDAFVMIVKRLVEQR